MSKDKYQEYDLNPKIDLGQLIEKHMFQNQLKQQKVFKISTTFKNMRKNNLLRKIEFEAKYLLKNQTDKKDFKKNGWEKNINIKEIKKNSSKAVCKILNNTIFFYSLMEEEDDESMKSVSQATGNCKSPNLIPNSRSHTRGHHQRRPSLL